MLRNLSIRAKLTALVTVPLVLLLLASAAVNLRVSADGADARRVAAFAASAPQVDVLLDHVRTERLRSVQVLVGGGEQAVQALAEARAATDAAGAEAFAALAEAGLEDHEGAVADAWAAVDEVRTRGLNEVRTAVDKNFTTPLDALNTYGTFTDTYVALTLAVAESATDRELGSQVAGFGYLVDEVDALATEQAAGWVAASGAGSAAVSQVRTTAIGEQEYFETQARARLDDDSTAVLDEALTSPEATAANAWVTPDRNLFASSFATPNVDPAQWLQYSGDVIDIHRGAASTIAQDVTNDADEAAAAATTLSVVIGLVSLAIVAATALFARGLGRGIGRRLRDLAEAATRVRDELPRMVERMQTPGEGPGVEFTPIPVTSDDEIGQLKVVINDLNETTFRIAGEQAALRASIAEMFVNVARRDQALLSRQLTFLDQLERTEENPDTLEDLFTLDHLATRMRRNAESLLVLAGINTGRRLRRPLPLSDVVRTAAGEIEHYDRVDLSLQVDPPVVGHLALSLSHLLAELLENATNFSDPGSRVVVTTSETDRGVEVAIRDSGLGMSAEEVEAAHQRISGGRASEFVGAQRLGFYVVGRLAARLDLDVRIDATEGGGTTVTLLLGAALFTPGSVNAGQPELAALDAAPDGAALSALPDALPSALPDALPSALPSALPDAVPSALPEVPAAGPSSIVANPLAADGIGSALSQTLQRSAAEAAAGADVVAAQPTAKLPGRSLPARRRTAGSAPAGAPAAPVEASAAAAPAAPAVPAPVAPAAPAGGSWQPPVVPVVPADAASAMPKRERKPSAPAALAPAQDILPKAGRKQRQVRETATPPKTAAEAFWTSRRKGADKGVEGVEGEKAGGAPVTPAAPAAEQFAPLEPLAPLTPRAEQPRAEQVQPAHVPAARTPEDAPVVPVAEEVPAAAAQEPVAPAPEPALPTRSTRAEATPADAGTRAGGEALRQRSSLAAEALSALTEGASFNPSMASGSQPLVRRQAGASPAAAKPAPARTAAARQRRAPADVRSMLSGFQAGVSRGRQAETADGTAPDGTQDPAGTAGEDA